MKAGTFQYSLFEKTKIYFYWSGNYWYCNEKDDKKNSGSGNTKYEAFQDFIKSNN